MLIYFKNFVMKKLLFLTIFLMIIFQISFAEDLDVPLLTDNASNMIKRDFEIIMSNLPENYLDDIYGSLTFDIGRFQEGLWCFMLDGIHFIQFTDWLYLPLLI
jgi:hypothetical protein